MANDSEIGNNGVLAVKKGQAFTFLGKKSKFSFFLECSSETIERAMQTILSLRTDLNELKLKVAKAEAAFNNKKRNGKNSS